MAEEKLLSIRNLKTRFFTPEGVVKAVNGVSFNVPKGKTLGVLGESGCGKSVTAMSILRLVPDPPGKISADAITFEGRDLLSLSPADIRKIRGNDIGMIFQEPMTSLNPVYTIGNQISEALILHRGLNNSDALDMAIEQLKLVGIPAPEKRVREYPHQLSGGMRQRAMIAMAISCRPQLLIADEPTTALDVTIQAQILDLMLELQETLGMAMMMITHDLGVISEVSDDIVVMYAGQVVESISVNTLFGGAKHPYTKGLLASNPVMGRKFKTGKKRLNEIVGSVPSLISLPSGCLFKDRCPIAFEKCKQRPPLFTIDKAHQVRCWKVEAKAVDDGLIESVCNTDTDDASNRPAE
ncbi:MAG: ABC transporter ATP-binding protein [Deltaproteobacteria bacterium]|nr:MAG: ABC transporter ATP-binding protein [Deltaproteobacteria bacterium]